VSVRSLQIPAAPFASFPRTQLASLFRVSFLSQTKANHKHHIMPAIMRGRRAAAKEVESVKVAESVKVPHDESVKVAGSVKVPHDEPYLMQILHMLGEAEAKISTGVTDLSLPFGHQPAALATNKTNPFQDYNSVLPEGLSRDHPWAMPHMDNGETFASWFLVGAVPLFLLGIFLYDFVLKWQSGETQQQAREMRDMFILLGKLIYKAIFVKEEQPGESNSPPFSGGGGGGGGNLSGGEKAAGAGNSQDGGPNPNNLNQQMQQQHPWPNLPGSSSGESGGSSNTKVAPAALAAAGSSSLNENSLATPSAPPPTASTSAAASLSPSSSYATKSRRNSNPAAAPTICSSTPRTVLVPASLLARPNTADPVLATTSAMLLNPGLLDITSKPAPPPTLDTKTFIASTAPQLLPSPVTTDDHDRSDSEPDYSFFTGLNSSAKDQGKRTGKDKAAGHGHAPSASESAAAAPAGQKPVRASWLSEYPAAVAAASAPGSLRASLVMASGGGSESGGVNGSGGGGNRVDAKSGAVAVGGGKRASEL
ncbi:hypothetical protein B0T26DRAFT_780644, partial [Lasiosphaeria miniovina]